MTAVVKPIKVRDSISQLRERWIHPHFAGYLCLKRHSARTGLVRDLEPDFVEFHDTFFRVPDASTQKPYLRVFLDEAPSAENLWLNKNVAGSYAPSSLRQGPFTAVVDVTGARREARYSLRKEHSVVALHALGRGSKIPVLELAAFLYRDYGVSADALTLDYLVKIFAEEFGFTGSPEADKEFSDLFEDESALHSPDEWMLILD